MCQSQRPNDHEILNALVLELRAAVDELLVMRRSITLLMSRVVVTASRLEGVAHHVQHRETGTPLGPPTC